MGSAAPWHVGSSQTRARTRVPCIGGQTLNHCSTREALSLYSWSPGLTYASRESILNLSSPTSPSVLHALDTGWNERPGRPHSEMLCFQDTLRSGGPFFKPLPSMSHSLTSYFGNSSYFSISKGKAFLNLLVKYYSFYLSHLFHLQSHAFAKITDP